jgi:AbiV family abortive infection protein
MSHGVQLAFRNAEDLFAEAELLREQGHHARSLALHQISIEECGKIEIIGGWAMHVFLGGEFDLEKMISAFRSHKAKNYANAYFTEVLGDELEAKKSGEVKAAVEAFKALQKKFHKDSNDAKNAALYVDFMDGQFVSPTDLITAETAWGTAAVNHHFLSLTWPKVGMVENLLKDTGPMKSTLTWMTEQVKKMKGEKVEDPEAAMAAVFEQMFERHGKEAGSEKK